MSQSKMSVADNTEKKFVIKHVFKNVANMKDGDTIEGPIEYHFNIPWKIRIWRIKVKLASVLDVYLDCMVPADNTEWSIDTRTSGDFFGKTEKTDVLITHNYYNPSKYHTSVLWTDLLEFVENGKFVYEFTVVIKKVTGLGLDITKKLKNFDDEAAKEDSDVTLIVNGQKFHVCKMYLSHHSTYFKSLFFGNFSESQKSDIELKDIDPNDFQYFLEFLYAESYIEAHSVFGILHLADFFDAKTAIKRCQEFLVQKSEVPLKQKFEAAIKYNLEELKTKCLSEMKTIADLRSIVPEEGVHYGEAVWKELFLKSLSLNSK